MRFKDGAPKKIYVLVWQDNGTTSSFLSKRERDYTAKWSVDDNGDPPVKAVYILESTDSKAFRASCKSRE